MIVEFVLLGLVGFAAFSNWPWWIAPMLGVVAGLWAAFRKAQSLGANFDDRSDRAMNAAAAAVPITIVVGLMLYTGVYFLVRWLAH
ncbi:MAG: hypothetical protein KDJ37_10375 [Hyphomicrobiaceae bacterium]|nr:hypothetical protein [Hyphomicrobiaceae bacterium]